MHEASKVIEKQRLDLEIEFFRGKSDTEAGYYEEGVPDPEHLDELAVWVDEEEVYNEEIDGFAKSGRLQVFISGSRRSYYELGKYLIAMSRFDALNSKYHDHLEDLLAVDGKAPVELIVQLPRPSDDPK